MKFKDFHKTMSSFIVFSNKDIKGIYGSFDRRRLYEWSKKEYITLLRKGYYIFNEFIDSPYSRYLAANIIYESSYISNEFALSYHGIIPEAVYTITSVTTKKTEIIETDIGTFNYKNIKSSLFTGYDLLKVHFHTNGKQLERSVKIASHEKALFDFIYYKPGIISIKDYRFDAEIIRKMDINKINHYISSANNKRCKENINTILSYYDTI